ncbi:MAG: ABC transporter permease [Desulfarculus sp.]|nr:ABC transporter permease [Desulfarculus sp.]MBV1740525.1 ABC transporter permease [Desulfarculus sp.]MBV1751258.1 ABC transporter permease [Desulfarculus sp.]
MFWKKFLHNPIGMIGVVVITLNILMAAFAPVLATHNPLTINVAQQSEEPSAQHWFGTDEFGRDIYSRVIYGSRISLYISLFSVLVATFLGVAIGATSGYYGGWMDNLIMRVMDAIMSFPAILLAIGILAVLGPNLSNVVLALGIVYTPRFARIVRGSVLSLKEKEFVEASKAIGNGDAYIIFRHILPNCTAPLIVQATASLAYAILAESMLSFLGLGAPPPAPSWGNILSDARNFMMDNAMMTVFPGLAITLAVLGFNLVGDALRDVLDPRLK